MGFPKGSISLNPEKDIPILLQVLHSRFITHNQLFEFMFYGLYGGNRTVFNWRVRRLVKCGLLFRHKPVPVTPDRVYSLTNAGAMKLANHCPVLDRGRQEGFVSTVHLTHSIELNELHLSLFRQGLLKDWQSEVTIRAKNELSGDWYMKNYDAIVTVWIGLRQVTFALEYERTAKKPKDYLRIRGVLEQENQLRCFLYIVPEAKLQYYILDCFRGTNLPLFVGLASDFRRSIKEMELTQVTTLSTRPMAAFL